MVFIENYLQFLQLSVQPNIQQKITHQRSTVRSDTQNQVSLGGRDQKRGDAILKGGAISLLSNPQPPPVSQIQVTAPPRGKGGGQHTKITTLKEQKKKHTENYSDWNNSSER